MIVGRQKVGLDGKAKPPSASLVDADRGVPFVEASFQQHEAALEVVFELGHFERRVEADLPIGEIGPSLVLVLLEQGPQQPPGDSSN